MIAERVQVDLSAYRTCDGNCCACVTRCAGNRRTALLNRCAALLLYRCACLLRWYTGLLGGHTGLRAAENTRHLAEMQWAFDLRRGNGWPCLHQGGRGQ